MNFNVFCFNTQSHYSEPKKTLRDMLANWTKEARLKRKKYIYIITLF